MKRLSLFVVVAGFLVGLFVLPKPSPMPEPAPAAAVSFTANDRSDVPPRLPPARASRSKPRRAHHVVRVNRAQVQTVTVGDVWLRLAQCEATGRWHVNTGNGYYGAFQVNAQNAAHYGFARADLLSPTDQVRLARLILRDQGVRAWPVCGPRVGLHRGA